MTMSNTLDQYFDNANVLGTISFWWDCEWYSQDDSCMEQHYIQMCTVLYSVDRA